MTTYLSTQEVADRLGVSVFTIRRYIRAGKLRAVKLDGAYRLSRDDLADFLKSRAIGGPPVPAGATVPSPLASSEADASSASARPQPPNSHTN